MREFLHFFARCERSSVNPWMEWNELRSIASGWKEHDETIAEAMVRLVDYRDVTRIEEVFRTDDGSGKLVWSLKGDGPIDFSKFGRRVPLAYQAYR
jgi:hypothetical protein